MTGQLDRALFGPGAYPAWKDDPDTPPQACRNEDPEVFYPEHGGNAVEAKAICRRCDAREICRAWALSRPVDEVWGVWGGMSRYDRKRALRHKPNRTDTKETR